MRGIVAALLRIGGAGYAHDTQSSHCHGGLVKHKCPNNPQLLEENQMPLATGVQTLTCIGWLDMLAHGFEFGGGAGGAVGGLSCVIQHHLLLTCPEGLTTFYTDCARKSRG